MAAQNKVINKFNQKRKAMKKKKEKDLKNYQADLRNNLSIKRKSWKMFILLTLKIHYVNMVTND